MGCGFPTGYGAVRKACKVPEGSTVAVWGLGAIGLATVVGAKAAGAKMIVAVDVQTGKADFGKLCNFFFSKFQKYWVYFQI